MSLAKVFSKNFSIALKNKDKNMVFFIFKMLNQQKRSGLQTH